MARRFSWCTVVALVVLLFVTTEGLRERNTQIDDHKPTSRGTLRFTSKSLEEATTVPSLLLSRSKATRGRLTPSKRSSNVDKQAEGTTLSPSINTELNFDPSKSSVTKTTRTSERGRFSATTETTNDLKRNPLSRNAGATKKPESGVNRRSGKRYSPDSDEAAILKNNEQKTPVDNAKALSRKASSGRSSQPSATERLDNRGPSVFHATTESSRSRTGRKIQTTYSMKDLKTQIPTSRRYVNKKFADHEATTVSVRRDGRGRSTTEKTERSTRSGRSKANNKENVSTTRRGPDTILSESESVRVDIPLTLDGTESPVPEVTTAGFATVSQRRSDVKDTRSSGRNGSERSKGRGRSNDSEAGSRRGYSKFNDFTTTEPTEQIARNTVSRDRSRGSDAKKSSASDSRSRSRGRNFENSVKANSAGALERDAKRKLVGERGSSDRRSRVLDAASRPIDSRGQDTQDTRVRTRNRPRSDVTTSATTDVTTTVAPDTTVSNDVTTINPDLAGTTIRPVTTVPTTASPRTTTRPSTTTSTTEAPARGRGRARGGNQGRKSKEDFFNHGLGFRGRKLSPEGSSNASESRRTTPSRNDPQSHGNPGWTLRRRPGHLNYTDSASRTVVPSPTDQTNEVIPPNEQSTSTEVVTTVEAVTSSTRRGFKKLQTADESTTMGGTTTKGYRRGNKTFGLGATNVDQEDNDNYPPEFKAKLNQLKNTDTKIPAPKTTSRSPLEVKRSSAALFAERSRMKLDLARSKTKPAGVTVAEETSKVVGKYSKPAATTAGRRTLTSIESSREEAGVKASKRSSSRKGIEDSSPKVIARPYSIKKGRIIAERMVTSISIEESVAPEETTKPYALATNPSVVTASTEEASATTIDSTKIRPIGNPKGKKSKEQDSKVPLNSKRRAENGDSVTIRPQKKSYSYQPRINKSQEQSTTIEQGATTIPPKKSHAFAQRKFGTPQEEAGTKKSIFGSGSTKPTFRPRYSKRNKQKLVDDKTENQITITTQQPIATSRYSRKKSAVKSTEDKTQPGITEEVANQARKLEFRPRTATYRRHSEVPTTLVQSTAKVDATGVAITPRSTKYHATLKTSTPTARSVEQEPQVNIRIANETTQGPPGIIGSSNGDSGNSNIFSPTRSTAILSGNSTLLEQVRSTVAPLLSSLGNRTPVFSGSYSNVNNVNSPPRITPSGQPPRFSARYKGAELFIRKQNNIYQPTVPSITSSSTTAVTPVETSGQAPLVDVVSPGEPRLLTLYQALESVSVRNEQLEGNTSSQQREQAGVVPQVDSNATVANGTGDNANNDTTSPTVANTSPQTPDTTANTIQDSTQTPRLTEATESSTPAVTTGAPETPSTTEPGPTSTEPSSNIDQASSTESPSASTDTPSGTEQASTSTEMPSTVVQASTSTEMPSTIVEASTSTEMPSTIVEASTSTEMPSGIEQASTSTEMPSAIEQASTSTEPPSSTEQVLTNTELPSSTEQVLTSTELPPSTEQVSSSTELPSSTEQVSSSTELPSSTEQVASSTELPSSTEQVASSTELPSSTEQVPTSTDSPSTPEQVSTNADSMPAIEQTGTTESPTRVTDATTMAVGSTENAQTPASSGSDSMNQELVSSSTDVPMTTSSVPETSSTELVQGTSTTTIGGNEQQTTEMQRLADDVSSTTDASQSSVGTTTVPITTTSENPETNTIPSSDTTATQTPEVSSTDASTTESEASNMIEADTTTAMPTTTIRTRLIDFAQDILSRLQASLSTTTVPSQESTTMSPATEISNVIPDSNGNSSLETLSQLREGTTTDQGLSGTTTQSSVTMDQSSLRMVEEVTTQSAVGSIATTLPTMVPTQEANTQDEINSFTTTTPVSITTTTTSTQDSQTVPPIEATTIDDSNSSSSTPGTPLDVEVTSTSTITSTNDTLLTELMSIAKTLLSEEIDDTEQVITEQNPNVPSRLGNLMELSSDVLSTTQTAESSSVPPDVTTESVESTTVAMPVFTTFSVDPSQNEVDSTNPTMTTSSETLTDAPTTTSQDNLPDNEIQDVQTTETTPIALGPLGQIVESTTPSFTTEDGVRATSSDSGSFNSDTGFDTTTQSQTIITTQRSETTITPITNTELTTNTVELSNLITTTDIASTQSATEFIGSTEPLTTVTSQLVTDTSTNQPEVTTVVPETTPSSVNTIATTPSTFPETSTQQTTTISTSVELFGRLTDAVVETNQTTESANQSTLFATDTPEATTPSIPTTTPLDVNSMDDTGVTTNQPPLTTTATESAMETTTNPPSETTYVPQTTPYLENETPTVVARFQDTTSATAQGTAGSGIGQTTEIGSSTIPTTIATTQPSSPESPASDSPPITTTSSPVETTTPTTTTETATATSIGRVPQTTGIDVVTVTPVTETTTPSTTMSVVNMEENLASTEAGSTTASSETMTTTSGPMSTSQAANDTTATSTPESTTTPGSNETASTAMPAQTTPGATMPTATMPPATPTSQIPTTPYLGRFGGSRLTPAPRFSLSSTTRAPLRDYLVYGIYPNKTIVRKRPEDNLIDARNVDSPYVIFGIFPDGRLVRKFPNGTIIPDPPRNPVEVVFSLSTSTTTNRPPPRPYYNQANQGTYNQYRGATFDNNGRPVAEPMRNVQSPGTVDLGLTGNAIVGPSGGGPDNTGPLGTPASVPSTNEMSNALLNTQMGTASIVSTGRLATDSQGGRIVQDRERDEATRTKEAGGQRSSVYIGQDKFVNYWTDGATTTNPRALSVKINSVATATNVGPSLSVPSFDNLLNNQPGGRVTAPPGFPWRDPLDQIFGITTSSPIITASVASNTLDDSSDLSGPVMARPINPFVEVFTPFSSAIGVPRGSIGTIPPPPTPTSTESSTAATTTTMMPSTTTTMAPTTTTTTTTMAPTTTTTTTTMAPTTTTTTTTMAPTTTTTTTTTTMAPTTTTTTMAPTTTTTTTTMAPTTTTTTTMAPTTRPTMPAPTTTSAPVTTGQRANIASQTAGTVSTSAPPTQTTQFTLPANLLNAQQQQNAFGTTFDDLAFLNSLLQSNSRSTTQKTLTQVEQLLANKILSLALNNPGSTRAPKAINIENVSPNSIFGSSKSPSEPIVIDLSPSSTASAPTWKPTEAQKSTTERSISSSTPQQVTQKPATSSTTKKNVEISAASAATSPRTTLISTTKGPIKVTPKPVTTPRPRTTTQQPLGFAGLLWQTLLGGGNLFGPSTTAKPVKSKQVKTTPKLVDITPKPIPTTQKTTQRPKTTTVTPSTTTARVVDVSKIHVNTNAIAGAEKSATTPFSVSTTKQPLLNNPNPRVPNVVTSTYSPEEDAKFLVELLRAVDQDNKSGGSKKVPGLSQDDESFLRAILSGQALVTTTPSPTSEISNAALLAALLKAQGIEPPTPSTNIREQLQMASLGQTVTSAPDGGSTTITTRSTKTATRPTDSAKRTVTPRPTSGPRIRTTTWSPSSTYPPPLFSSFPGVPEQASGDDSRNGALFGATRAFSQFLGAALSGAAQQLQSLVRNGTRIVSEVVG
ncbi:unnamed protein product [Xylocopa violacea]|uniref:Uncharacterized protein n=1 Tax=Xylocopa violacea TaxID=135666 RepID=A0ABP1P4X1_XYLVO